MQSHKKTLRLAMTIAIVFTVMITLAVSFSRGQDNALFYAQDQLKEKDEDPRANMPIVDYKATTTQSQAEIASRRAKSSRYDKRRPEPITELPSGIDELPVQNHWWWGLPSIPTAQSDLVVVGEITSSQAFLSDDLTGVYSEFGVRPKEILKNQDQSPLSNNVSITVTREGGAVRFPSGRIQRYSVANQYPPRIGRQYLLFLKRDEQGGYFSILTGYELRDGRVAPLDPVDQFLMFKNADESTLLNDVRNSITSQPHSQQMKGGWGQ